MKTITNPNEPASKPQTFAIYLRTGYDVRGCKLNRQQASDIIEGKLDVKTIEGAVWKKDVKQPQTDATNKGKFQAIYDEAHAAGMEAGAKVVPIPMQVVEHANPLDDKSRIVRAYEPVMDGACGFAWIAFKGNTAWGRWCKLNKLAGSHYPSGLCVWVGEFNQSVTRKEAYAEAFAQVLRNHGIDCHAGSRLD